MLHWILVSIISTKISFISLYSLHMLHRIVKYQCTGENYAIKPRVSSVFLHYLDTDVEILSIEFS